MADAMRATGQSTKRGTVEETLRRAVASQRRLQAIEDRRRSTMSESVGSLAGRGRQGSTAREWPTGFDREGFATLLEDLRQLLEPATMGDPMRPLRPG